MHCAIHNSYAVADVLLKQSAVPATVNLTDKEGRTALIHAAIHGSADVAGLLLVYDANEKV